MPPRQHSDWLATLLGWVAVLAFVLFAGWCSHTLGTSRATVADVRAVETQVAERCR